MVVGIGGHKASVGYLIDPDELIQGVVGIIEAAVAGHVAVLIVGEARTRDLVDVVVGKCPVSFGRKVAGSIICVILLDSAVKKSWMCKMC
ncbi:hypothetical protein [Desulfofarcimen acetoxidans]|uniref:hypothetical protein n=1 Tax=Desulfofarcimen acetoxidans TaxID=58138 RepID=UPI001F61CC93|nr:hypothetical protein [Desulfofarcimen acetoxidans]